MKKAELVVDAKASLGEGPSWDAEKNLLYWVDIPGEKVHIYDPVNNTDRTVSTGQFVSTVVPANSGELILTMHHGFYSLDLETEELNPIVDPESHISKNRFNDGKCDAAGRFWAGTMAINESKEKGALYCLEKDFSVKKVLDQVSISNGIAWDDRNKTMYYIDTPTKKIVAFDFELDSGTINNKRIIIDFPKGKGFPDGMNIDAEGMLWIAHWDGSKVSRWNPNNGEMLDSISVPVSKVTSCAFGGKNLDELYITTARVGLSEEELSSQLHAGGLFKVIPGVKGTETYKFDGKI
jgi:sugar lactone lactonase YvrE